MDTLRRDVLIALGLVVILQLVTVKAVPPLSGKKATCGYESCPAVASDMLNVHLVPHTHLDVGWLKTVDQYYYGSRSDIQRAGVQYILDSVIRELLHDPKKRFIFAETAFFWKWWKEQHDHVRHQVKNLVNEGRLEMVGGGWTMHDEATTHYMSTVDQMTWGLRRLNDTFGACGRPRVAWQIDPFGHSRESASLFAQMGFDGLFFGRLDYQDKDLRKKMKNMETVWQGSDTLGKSSWLFTSALFNAYSPPPGFCFDLLCNDEPIIDGRHSPEYNVKERVADFLGYVKEQSKNYVSNNILLTMGEDFNYQDANAWFKNLDKLIEYVNKEQKNGSRVNVLYSTPSCYLKSLYDAKKTWTVKKDDFLPYASDPHAYWTGFYTSRPALKFFERLGNNFLQVCKQLITLTQLGPEDWADVTALQEAMGILQHHDAITGTEKQAVADDYARQLWEGVMDCEDAAQTAFRKLFEDSAVEMKLCPLLNISQCELSETNNKFVVTLYNPLAHPVSHHVRLPVVGNSYKVIGPNGSQIASQMIPIPGPVLAIPGRASQAQSELVFRAENLPPLGYRSYYVSRISGVKEVPRYRKVRLGSRSTKDVTIGNKNFQVEVDGFTGLLRSVNSLGTKIPLQQNFYYYEGANGNNTESQFRASGAYIFRPIGSQPHPLKEGMESLHVVQGGLIEEIHQKFNDWISQVIRVYKEEDFLEFEWLVGPIPVSDGVGKEVISRFKSSVKSGNAFLTELNGREVLQRQRNGRPTWKLNLTEPVASNYYPITSRIAIQGETVDDFLAILPDRSQGGSSLAEGQIELMVHRRLLFDDAFGVGEPLNETAFGDQGLVVRGRHVAIVGGTGSDLGSSISPLAQQRLLAERLLLKPLTLLSSTTATPEQWLQKKNLEFSGLKTALPLNVRVLTLEPWRGNTYLLRLEHQLQTGDDPVLSKPATVDLKNLLSCCQIISAKETTLAGNQWLNEGRRLEWNIETNDINQEFWSEEDKSSSSDLSDDFTVTLQPMQIRTFVIEMQ